MVKIVHLIHNWLVVQAQLNFKSSRIIPASAFAGRLLSLLIPLFQIGLPLIALLLSALWVSSSDLPDSVVSVYLGGDRPIALELREDGQR